MSLRLAAFRGARTLGIGQAGAQGLMFARNVIVARQLSQEDVGIGFALMSSLALVEMVSSVRPDAMLIQAEDGDDPPLQGSVQSLEALRGLISGLALFLLATPLSFWFGVPEAAWAFQVTAALPVLRGIAHLDATRFQRQLNYIPSLAVAIVPQVLAALAAYPIAVWAGDYSAVLWLMLLRATTATAISHFVAKRRYNWNFNKEHFRRIVSYGWPLLLTGILIYLVLQGDRFIIGSRYTHYSIAALGLYAISRSSTNAVRQLIAATVNPVLLPVFSRARGDMDKFSSLYSRSCQALSVIAACSCVPFFLLGGDILGWAFGEEYRGAASFIGWLAATQAVNMLCHPPTHASLALADTRNPLFAGCVRATSLLVMILVAAFEAPLAGMAFAGLVGEAAALVACARRLQKSSKLQANLCLRPARFTFFSIFFTWGVSLLTQDIGPMLSTWVSLGLLTIILVAGALLFPSMRLEASTVLREMSFRRRSLK